MLHDDIGGTGGWPGLYDGRAIVGPFYEQVQSGASLDDVVKEYMSVVASGDFSKKVFWV